MFYSQTKAQNTASVFVLCCLEGVLVNSYFGQFVPKNSYFAFPWSTRTLCLWSARTF